MDNSTKRKRKPIPPFQIRGKTTLMRHRLTNLSHAFLLAALLTIAATAATAQQRAAAITDTPGEILRAARTIYIAPGRAVEANYLQYKLLRTDALADWGISIVEDKDAADLHLAVEQVRLNYIFRITDPRTSTIVVSGKVVAVNDPVAADFLGTEIIKRMRNVRRLR